MLLDGGQNAFGNLPTLRGYRFWQRGGGYDRNLRTTRDIHEKIQYIHNNPVRRGLVDRPGDWAWSSYGMWEDGHDGVVGLDWESLPALET
jgi:putative transposase